MLSGMLAPAALSAQLDAVPADAVIGVNFLVPFMTTESIEQAALRSALVEFFWGWPSDVVDRVHGLGGRVAWQVGSVEEARAAREVGCDVVVAQGIEGGGHVRGSCGTFELLDQVRAVVDIPIVAAGGFGDGRAVAAALRAGAAGVRIGTRFLVANESVAHPAYVERLIAATADDTVVTTAFGTGWPDAPHRVLRSCIEAGNALGAEQSWSPDWPDHSYVGRSEARALYAGRSVDGVTRRQSAAAIVAELMAQAEAEAAVND